MPTDLERKVAEMPCSETTDSHGHHHKDCSCQGTGLRWLPLSRECSARTYVKDQRLLDDLETDWVCSDVCNFCHGSGRMPDVTLEKVLELLVRVPTIVNIEIGYAGVSRLYWNRSHPRTWHETGETMLESACAALLASVQA